MSSASSGPTQLTYRTSRALTVALIALLAVSIVLLVAGSGSRGAVACLVFVVLVGREFLLGRTVVNEQGIRPGWAVRVIPWADIEGIEAQPRFKSPDNTVVTVTRRGRRRPVPLWGTKGADLAAITSMRPGRAGRSGNPQKASR